MKTLLPEGRHCSDGVRRWVALVAALGISCFPVVSAFANQHGGGGHMGGGGGHFGGGRAGGGSHSSAYRRSGPLYSSMGRSFSHGYHADLYARHNESAQAFEHRGTTVNHGATTMERRTNNGVTNHDAVNHSPSTTHSVAESHALANTNRVDPPTAARAATANRTNTFNHSITTSRAQGLMGDRLTQISNRQWTEHGTTWSNHFDPGRGCWFQHGGYWWPCNFWGANWYCNNLIVLGFAPGLCWGWYDDICWGNIVVGMPLDLVDYYYPDPVYSTYSTYDGDEATVYYYAMSNGQYKQVTVIDGNVVDVQIVDQIG